MKRSFSLILLLAVSLLFFNCNKKSDTNDEDTTPPEETNPEAIVIDHSCIDYRKIPTNWITQAKTILRATYGHTSHGSQLVTGITALMNGLGGTFQFTLSGGGYDPSVFLNDYGMPGADDLGSPDRTAWSTATRDMLQRGGGCNRNVVIWSWCGQVSDSSVADIDHYLGLMNTLEIGFPDVKFVYMTGHLDGSGANGNLHLRNEQIRTYCRTYKKILFDFADIESHDPDGRSYLELDADDGCNYSGGNWAQQWSTANPGHIFVTLANQCDDCAHSERLNCVLKAGAYWWLMARLAGWNGV